MARCAGAVFAAAGGGERQRLAGQRGLRHFSGRGRQRAHRRTWRVRFEDQEYSRYWRSYRRDAWYSLGDWEVSLDGEALTLLEAPSEERPEGCFAVVEDGSDVRVEIYHRSENVAREIRIAYTVENAVILHDDVAEFRWDLTSASEISYTAWSARGSFCPAS